MKHAWSNVVFRDLCLCFVCHACPCIIILISFAIALPKETCALSCKSSKKTPFTRVCCACCKYKLSFLFSRANILILDIFSPKHLPILRKMHYLNIIYLRSNNPILKCLRRISKGPPRGLLKRASIECQSRIIYFTTPANFLTLQEIYEHPP